MMNMIKSYLISAYNYINNVSFISILNGFLIGLLSLFLLHGFPFCKFQISNSKLLIISIILSLTTIFGLFKTSCKINPIGTLISIILFFFSTGLNKPYNLFIGPSIKGEIILFTLIFYLLISLKKTKLINTLFILSPIFLTCIFLIEGQKGTVWSDDNPTFIYRLEALKRFFPSIPFYYTGWNSGLDARDFFATGALNVFFLAYPIIKFVNIAENYNVILAYLIFIILPLSSIIACKILKKDFRFTSIVTILTVTNSLFWYRWALKYGTLGFITSASLVPLVFVLTSKLLSKEAMLSAKEAILLVLTTTLLLLWSASGLVFIPCIIYACLFIKRIILKKYSIKIILSLLLLNLPWITVFWSASNVSNFITSEKKVLKIETTEQHSNLQIKESAIQDKFNEKKDFKSRVSKITLANTVKNFKNSFTSINPIIYFFAFASIFVISGTYKILYTLTLTWLLFLGTVISQIKPQMEFDRMLIILAILSIIPVTECITRILNGKSLKCLNAFLLSFIFVGIFAVGNVLKNRSLETYYHKNENVDNLITFLKNYDAKGRVLFSGFILHDFGNGHIAPFPFLTGKQIIASSPFHNVWRYTEVIPHEFLTKPLNDALIEKYLNFQNIELIVAHEKVWRDYFLNNNNFKEIYHFNNYKVFKYENFKNSYLISGKVNDIKIYDNKIILYPNTKELILKFNFFPFLKTSNCKISNHYVSKSLNFIKLTDCDIDAETTIQSKNAFLRVAKK